jgi:hypothetical protein
MSSNGHLELIDFCHEELGETERVSRVETVSFNTFFNILRPSLKGTTIECDGAFNDNHPPTNLTSKCRQLKTKGFLAEYYMKPPVSLVLTFKYPIHLCKIFFHPKVQKELALNSFNDQDLD